MAVMEWLKRAATAVDRGLAAVFPTSAMVLELAELRNKLEELGVGAYEPVEASETDEEGVGWAATEPFEPFEGFGGSAEPAEVFPLVNTNGVPMNGIVDMNGSLYGFSSDNGH